LSDSPIVLPTTRDLPLPVFFGLREGTYRQLVADNAEGIISLHAALGALFIFALWPVKWLHRIALFINLVMIAATPIEGSHYFTDVIAGLVVATLYSSAVRRLLLSDGKPSPTTNLATQEDTGSRPIAAPGLSS
jgi:membrane-associated phospholipid phosphatase